MPATFHFSAMKFYDVYYLLIYMHTQIDVGDKKSSRLCHYAIPLHQRLATTGRNLTDVTHVEVFECTKFSTHKILTLVKRCFLQLFNFC